MGVVKKRHRSIRLAVSSILATVACLVAACSTTTTPPPEPSGPLLAYRAASEIGLVDGTTVVATAPGSFAPSSDPLATEDGKFVFARSSDGGVTVLDVAARTSRAVAVPIDSTIGTGGGSTIVWWEQPNRLMQLDLADPTGQPALRQEIDLPRQAGASDAALLTARNGTVVVARTESEPSPFGGPDTLYAVHGDAEPTSLGTADANTPVASAVLSPDGSRLAYALYRRTSNSCGTAAIVVSDADGSQETYDVAAPNFITGSQVLGMWWPDGKPMSLSLATWKCETASYYSPLTWQLGDAGLVEADPRTVALEVAEVVPGQRALIVPKVGVAPEPSGTLVIEDSGRRFPLGPPAVDAIAVVGP